MTTQAKSYVPFNKAVPLEQRKAEADKIKQKYPDRIPIIVERSELSKNTIPDIDKHKFLAPKDITVGQFNMIIRKRIQLKPEQAMFLFVGGKTLLPSGILMSQAYKEYANKETNFLEILYSAENTFGSA